MTWTFFSNHGNILVYLDEHPDARLREIAEAIGITERAAHKIVTELHEAGCLTRERDGRRNHYVIHGDVPLRHPALADHTVGEMLRGLTRERRTPRRSRRSGGTRFLAVL
jgi:DNA-binding transcriptional regulator PaaX